MCSIQIKGHLAAPASYRHFAAGGVVLVALVLVALVLLSAFPQAAAFLLPTVAAQGR
jgi:hypothetical protein